MVSLRKIRLYTMSGQEHPTVTIVITTLLRILALAATIPLVVGLVAASQPPNFNSCLRVSVLAILKALLVPRSHSKFKLMYLVSTTLGSTSARQSSSAASKSG